MMYPDRSLSPLKTPCAVSQQPKSTELQDKSASAVLSPRLNASFRTSQEGVLRTVGSLFQLPANDGIEDWGAPEARVLWRMHEREVSGAAARGKVAFVDQFRRSTVYQATPSGAALVACGNATAALAAMVSRNCGGRDTRIYLSVPGVAVTVDATTLSRRTLSSVEQIWTIHADCSTKELLVGVQPTNLVEFLNSYLVVPYPLIVDPTDLIVMASRDLDVPLARVRLAVVDPSASIPYVEFYGANGRHGAAPQTGLVTLALVAPKISWMRSLVVGQVVRHPGGIEPLPKVELGDSGFVRAHLPTVSVQLIAI